MFDTRLEEVKMVVFEKKTQEASFSQRKSAEGSEEESVLLELLPYQQNIKKMRMIRPTNLMHCNKLKLVYTKKRPIYGVEQTEVNNFNLQERKAETWEDGSQKA